VPFIAKTLVITGKLYLGFTSYSLASGVANGAGSQGLLNSGKLLLCNFYLDETNYFEGIGKGITSFYWEMLQIISRYGFLQFRN
jgi:hypothetical protein